MSFLDEFNNQPSDIIQEIYGFVGDPIGLFVQLDLDKIDKVNLVAEFKTFLQRLHRFNTLDYYQPQIPADSEDNQRRFIEFLLLLTPFCTSYKYRDDTYFGDDNIPSTPVSAHHMRGPLTLFEDNVVTLPTVHTLLIAMPKLKQLTLDTKDDHNDTVNKAHAAATTQAFAQIPQYVPDGLQLTILSLREGFTFTNEAQLATIAENCPQLQAIYWQGRCQTLMGLNHHCHSDLKIQWLT